MAVLWRRFAIFVVVFLTLHSAFSTDPPKFSPSPAPEVGGDAKISPPPTKPPASSPDNSSPPAPPPSGSPSPTPAPGTSRSRPSPSPSPAQTPTADSDEAPPSPAPSENYRAADSVGTEAHEKKSGGMSAGKKAAVALGVMVAVAAVVVAGVIYKKRQDNIQRSQYGYATRTGLI